MRDFGETEVEGTQVAQSRRSVGRPPDPRIEAKARAVALALYAEQGWGGFSFEAICRRAAVGKAALYRRWASREELLIDAIRGVEPETLIGEVESLREGCRSALDGYLDWWISDSGGAYLRLQVDQQEHEFLGELYRARVTGPLLETFRSLVDQAVESGEVPMGTSAALLVEGLFGTVLMRLISLSVSERQLLLAHRDSYIERVLDFVLGGAAAAAQEH